VLDARTIGSGLGLVVLATAAAALAGQSPDAVASAAGSCADQVGSFFAVDRPDALLAGGRAAAWQGGHGQVAPGDPDLRLVSRTVLRISAGRITTVDRVRTWAGAAALLAESAMEHAASLPVGRAFDVVVEHVAAARRASALADQLAVGLGRSGRVSVVTAGTAIRVHTGPGMLGVSVAPSPDVG
jgi:fatty acid-binding protein DegV